ncbi:anion permease [Eubacterium multiforme]|uniref:DASS family divalent anion:Na+ symporter n=1 Tax=Eubacterium multiforme TaxID=83339 RepID=A0ABT9UNK2_9FIRM|nr:anion permease [Eubacterium multiforme]MDQ0148222.1 DASS family divalent anion:Na+ symporter [Eubacterium multiforme]
MEKNNTISLPSNKYIKFSVCIAIGIILWLIPHPIGVSAIAWHMLAIFIATIIGFILRPFPIGAVAIIGVTLAIITHTITMKTAFSGFSKNIIWLVVMAFFISRGLSKTGLGSRIAYKFIEHFGKKTLGLCYSIVFCDLILAPATPSNTARAGGIISPIVTSLAKSFGSDPENGTERKIGSFLMFSEFHGNIITSAMFMTAMAANPLAKSLAASFGIQITWFSWFLAALVPGVISLIVIPFIIYKLFPPEIKSTPDAPKLAEESLKKMGKLKNSEKIMALIFILVLVLWIFGGFLHINTTLTALIGFSLLLIFDVLNWDDVKSEKGAWDVLIWFSILVMMADQLNKLGLISYLRDIVKAHLTGFPWPVILIALLVVFFYSHYLFASATAHVSAMYSAFLGIALAEGVPPMLAAISLALFANLFASTTHYANGPATILYSSGYVPQNKWWGLNFILGIFYFIIWLGIGSLWWKLIGMY